MIIPDHIDFERYLEDMSVLEAQDIRWASDWADALADRVKNGREIKGHKLPWGKTQDYFRLRGGELTVWAGINGHKKSMLVGQIMLWIAQHSRICIASLEMKPEETLLRMCRQAAGCFPAEDFARAFALWADQRICLYDQIDTVDATRILGMVHYSAKELGCKHIVIDSLMKCGLDEADYKAEKKFIDRLQWAAKRYNVHLHLIAHVRKSDKESNVPNKFDVAGASAITNIADNVVICWMDKAKEEVKKKQSNGFQLGDADLKQLEGPDQKMIVVKQRHGDWEGSFALWFHDQSLQFIASEGKSPIPFSISGRAAA